MILILDEIIVEKNPPRNRRDVALDLAGLKRAELRSEDSRGGLSPHKSPRLYFRLLLCFQVIIVGVSRPAAVVRVGAICFVQSTQHLAQEFPIIWSAQADGHLHQIRIA
jgi:hypothetical protein